MKTYFALVHKNGSFYEARFQEFPGCVATGASIEETLNIARQCLSSHIETMIEDNIAVPNPTKPDLLMSRLDGALTVMGIPHESPRGKQGNCCGGCGG